MIEVLKICDLSQRPKLAHTMFRDRTKQFRDRLKWKVSVNAIGYEIDEYDDEKTTYVVAHDGEDKHLGSLRLRDVADKCMLSEKFGELLLTADPLPKRTLEVTRYCLSSDIYPSLFKTRINNELFSTAHQFASKKNYSAWVGIFNQQMEHIYKRNKWNLRKLSSIKFDGQEIVLGVWSVEDFVASKEDQKVAV